MALQISVFTRSHARRGSDALLKIAGLCKACYIGSVYLTDRLIIINTCYAVIDAYDASVDTRIFRVLSLNP